MRLLDGAIWRRDAGPLELPAPLAKDALAPRVGELPPGAAWAESAGDRRRALWLEPARVLRCALELPPTAPRLRLALLAAPPANGAGLRIAAALEGGPELSLFDEPEIACAARWRELELELPAAWGGATVEFSFRSGAAGAPLALAEPRLVGAPDSAARGARPQRRGPNVLLVVIDGLRADRLGCFGSARAQTPAIDALARSAWLFERCWTALPSPSAGKQSLLSGRFVAAAEPVDAALPLWFARQGYETAAFGPRRPEDHGLGPAAAAFDRLAPWGLLEGESADSSARASSAPLEWIERCSDQPFFLLLHGPLPLASGAGPAPPSPSPPASEASPAPAPAAPGDPDPIPLGVQRQGEEQRYAAALSRLDAELGRLLSALEAAGLREHTLVAVTASVGFELGERGGFGAGRSLYEEQLHVPLILSLPGKGTGRSPLLASSLDLAPTLLSAAGLTLPGGLDGHSLFAGRGSTPRPPPGAADRRLFSWSPGPPAAAASLRGPLKALLAPASGAPPEPAGESALCFDLALDPGELDPRPLPAERRAELEQFLGQGSRSRGFASAAPATPSPPATEALLAAVLEALGLLRR
mgnify:CR=1 FL=1